MKMLSKLIESGDVSAIKQYMQEHDLVIKDGRIVPRDDNVKKRLKDLSEFWNQRQQARKILLNSLYGALLNEGLRFYDERIGQSVTLSGRSIVKHMNAKVNEIVTGLYDYLGEACQYSDTDSTYFTPFPLKDNDEWRNSLFSVLSEKDKIYEVFDFDNRSHIIKLCDDIADILNDSFPDFMANAFNTSTVRGGIIQAGRELVASSALFIKKKKYAVLMYDKEGVRLDTPKPGENSPSPGKLKAMGLDLKRSDTPKFMQQFLENILMDVLQDATKTEIMDKVMHFREEFKDRPAIEKGSPKKVNGLTKYHDKIRKTRIKDVYKSDGGKANLPGHVRASLNWNKLCEINNDKYSMRITDGSRIIVCRLKPNPTGMDSVAYPMDEPHLPKWFLELPFDEETMEEIIIDKKLDNLVGVLGWDFEDTKARPGDEFFTFKGR